MSMLQIHNQSRLNALNGYGNLAQLERNRNQYNQQASAQNKAKMGSAISSGIGVGMMIGGPMGIAVGGGLALAGMLF